MSNAEPAAPKHPRAAVGDSRWRRKLDRTGGGGLRTTQITLPVIAFFALKWFPSEPGRVVQVLALQLVAAVAAMAPVWRFNW